MKKWYLISSKPDDIGACNRSLIECNKKTLVHVYHHEEVGAEDVETLKKYFDVVDKFAYEDFYESLEEYLEEHYW